MNPSTLTRQWYTYHFDTDMDCPKGCGPGAHPLYEGMSCQPWVRVLQHAQTQPWWGYQTGYQVHPGVHGSQRDAEAVEYDRIRGNRPLGNIRHNEDNPCRWDFGPVPARRGQVARSGRRVRWWRRRWVRPVGLLALWLVLTVALWLVAGTRMPGWSGLRSSALVVSALYLAVWRLSRPRRSRRRRR